MTIEEQIKSDMKEAMMAKDSVRLGVVRGIKSAFTNELVAQGKAPDTAVDDETAMTVIKKEAKKRKDSISQFEAAGRPELAEDEKAELAVIETYLPAMMTVDAIRPIAQAKIAEMGVTDKSGMGQLIGAVMKECGGQADGNDVKAVVEELLG